jgi:hypothetical protein
VHSYLRRLVSWHSHSWNRRPLVSSLIYFPSHRILSGTATNLAAAILATPPEFVNPMYFSQVAFSISITLVAAVSAGPISGGYYQRRVAAFALQNGQDAQALNRKFQSLSTSSSCNTGDQACVQGQFAQCVGGKFVLSQCASTLQCVALPLVNKPGTRYVL